MWRLKPNGGDGALDDALDTTFSTDGRVPIDSGGDSERATAIALAPDNKVLVAGITNNAPHSSAATVFRLTPGGSLDSTFDTDGAAAVDLDGFASAAAVGVQPDGKILLAGSVKVGSNPFVAALWRLNAGGGPGPINGAVDPTFGIAGATTVASGTGVGAGSLVLQPDRRIVVAGSVFDGQPARVPGARRPVRADGDEGRDRRRLGAVLACGDRVRPDLLGHVRRRHRRHADGDRRDGVDVRRLVGRRAAAAPGPAR